MSEGLLDLVEKEYWRENLKIASKQAEEKLLKEPELKFEAWGAELGPEIMAMISGMVKSDPKARLTIDQVMEYL